MTTVVVLEEAVEDLQQARRFYERIAPGLGRYCLDCLWSDIERLVDLHGVHATHFGFHRLLSERFPFGVYYRKAADRVEVFAVLDLRRDPSWLHEEIPRRS